MLRNKFVVLFVLIIAVLSFGMVSMAQDEVLELTLLQDGDSVEGFLSPDQTSFLYVFNANEGDEVTISLAAEDDAFDPFLGLWGPAGQVIATNDDVDYDGGDFSSLLEEVELPETGTYFILVSNYNLLLAEETESDDEVAFELTVDGISEVEDMGEGFLFYAAELLDAEPLLAEISEEQGAWFFVFSGSEGDVVSISATSEEFDTIAYVFGPGGARVAMSDDIDFEEGDVNSFIEEFELPADGVYFVVISNPFVLYYGVEDVEEFTEAPFGEFTIELTAE